MWPREFISERECMHVGSDYDLPPCILTGAHSLCKQDLLRIFLLFQFVCFFSSCLFGLVEMERATCLCLGSA